MLLQFYAFFQVEDIETKLDLLIDLYKDDRKILLQMKSPSPERPSSESNQQSKPRSILIDKQYTSEPSSPTCFDKHPKKVMLRNHSDLGSRIRKRVTYRLNSVPLKQFGEPVRYDDNEVFDPLQPDYSEITDGIGNVVKKAKRNNPVVVRTDSKDDIAEEVFSNESFDSKNDETIAHYNNGKSDSDAYHGNQNQEQDNSNSSSNANDTDSNENGNIGDHVIDVEINEPEQDLVNADNLADDYYDEPEQSDTSDQEKECLLSKSEQQCIVNIDTCENHRISVPRSASQGCVMSLDRLETDHVVLLPLGSVNALKADSSDV